MTARQNVAWMALAAMLTAVAPPAAAADDKVVTKRATFTRDQSAVTLTVGYREMFDATLIRRLRSGFAVTVVARLLVYPQGDDDAVAGTARTIRAVYDLWDDRYLVTVEDQRGRRTSRHRSQKEVIDRLTSFWRFPLVGTAQLAVATRYVVAGVVEVNPMSQEILTEVRRWLRRPYRRKKSAGTRENFFGSFVSVFVNDEVHRAEKVFKFRTQPFVKADAVPAP